jgi:hypothetical protein
MIDSDQEIDVQPGSFFSLPLLAFFEQPANSITCISRHIVQHHEMVNGAFYIIDLYNERNRIIPRFPLLP